jgi:tetraacyldisaccharide 4'-kinase
MLKERLPTVPILAGANRFKTASEFLKNHSVDVFLMDDGFQHWKLQRDLEIVVLDAASPWGNGHLIPRGILREHLSGLRRADMIVLAKADLGEGLSSINKKLQQIGLNKTPVVEAQHRPEHLVDVRKQQGMSLDFIRDKKVCLFSGIGNPASFTQTVQQLGARISKQFNFMDHHVYTKEDAQTISRFCLQEKINILLTTHKDAVKLKSLLNEFDTSISLVIISINVSLTRNENVFAQRIHHLLHR